MARLVFTPKSILSGSNTFIIRFIVNTPFDLKIDDLVNADRMYSRIQDFLQDFMFHTVQPLTNHGYNDLGALVRDIYQALMEEWPKSVVKSVPLSLITMEFEHPSLHILIP